MRLAVRGIDSEFVNQVRNGGNDANGQRALSTKAVGLANPCRHCLQLIAEGDDKLVLAYRPFSAPQPYAEVGPIFLHQRECPRYEGEGLPDWFAYLQPALIRGYGHDDRECGVGRQAKCRVRANPGKLRGGIRSHSLEVQLLPVSG